MGSGTKVSIGLPVFNGERYLGRAIESMLAQTHGNFELVISDNGSNDATAEICQIYARQDPRIRHARFEETIALWRNWNRALELTSARYFMWLAFDDWFDPTYLEKCVGHLDADRDAAVCFAQTVFVRSDGQVLGSRIEHLPDGMSGKARQRFHDTLWGLETTPSLESGVMRRAALQRTARARNSMAAGRLLASELALIGHLRYIREPLYFRHISTEQQERSEWHYMDTANQLRNQVAFVRVAADYWNVLLGARLRRWEKAYLMADLMASFGARRARTALWHMRRLGAGDNKPLMNLPRPFETPPPQRALIGPELIEWVDASARVGVREPAA